MLKSRWLFLNVRRAAVIANRSQIRCKTQCMDGSIIPAPFRGPPAILINSPYSVKIEPLDPVEYSNLQVVVGFLYVKTEVEEDLTDQVKTKFQKDIRYKVQSVLSPTRDYVEVRLFDFPIRVKLQNRGPLICISQLSNIAFCCVPGFTKDCETCR